MNFSCSSSCSHTHCSNRFDRKVVNSLGVRSCFQFLSRRNGRFGSRSPFRTRHDFSPSSAVPSASELTFENIRHPSSREFRTLKIFHLRENVKIINIKIEYGSECCVCKIWKEC